MLDDFRHDRQEQTLDPLAEGTSLPLSKKIALLSIVIALVGLFIFFTSDSLHSDTKTSSDIMAKQIEELQNRVSELEQKTQNALPAPLPQPQQAEQPATLNLQSIIDQEFQEAAAAPTKESKPQAAKTSAKTYVVQKGDSLSKISSKCYGTTKKWKKILDANKDKLGNNQTIRPGMTLSIPQDE